MTFGVNFAIATNHFIPTTMYKYNPLDCLPSSAELPDSDDTPVDNELQILIPNLLLAILATIWQSRDDWFFGINMGWVYIIRQIKARSFRMDF